MQAWIVSLVTNYVLKNWRTTLVGVIGYVTLHFPQVTVWLTAHGYSIADIQSTLILVIALLAKDGATTGVAPGPEGVAVPQAAPPAGYARLRLLILLAVAVGALSIAKAAHAQDTTPPPPKLGVLSFDLGNFDTHFNVGFSGVQVDLKTGAASYEVVSGLYAICYKPWRDVCGAGGGNFTLQAGKVTGAGKVGVISPQILNPFQPGSGTGGFRVAVTYTHDFATNGDLASGGMVFTF